MYDDAVSRKSDEFKELMSEIDYVAKTLTTISAHLKPMLNKERYLTGNEVMDLLHITRRTLQEYRNNFLIPFTTIGGVILYPESEIDRILEKNHYIPPK